MTPPAPIDPAALEATLAPFRRSRTLPAEAYRSPAVYEWEREHLFRTGWTCVGRVGDLAGPGQVGAVESAAGSLLVVGEPPAVFSNVCRHRGHELVPPGPPNDARLIRCPYHSWTYRLDGSLRTARQFNDTPGFDPDEWPLLPVPSTVWRGWLFVDPSGTAGPIEDHVGNLDDLLAPYDPARLVRGAGHVYESAANWKLIVENYHECYHCSTIHPALCRVSPPDSGTYLQPTGHWMGGSMFLVEGAETMSLDGRSQGLPLGPALDGEVLYAALWPNLLVSSHPDYVMTHTLVPMAPDRTRIVCEWFFAPEAVARDGFSPAYAVDFWDLTNREDLQACEGVQRGVESGGYRPGPLHPSEATVYQFLHLVAHVYLGNGLEVPVVPSELVTG
jgi:Rieske 2Fe-2S family protein